jgi:tRNA A37 threonylcarbamoyladenosine dehydratase
MNGNSPDQARQDRLAAKLRENLRRRKAQARELAPHLPSALSKADDDG